MTNRSDALVVVSAVCSLVVCSSSAAAAAGRLLCICKSVGGAKQGCTANLLHNLVKTFCCHLIAMS